MYSCAKCGAKVERAGSSFVRDCVGHETEGVVARLAAHCTGTGHLCETRLGALRKLLLQKCLQLVGLLRKNA